MPWHEIDDPERLKGLVDAMLLVGSDLTVDTVLHHIVEAAVGLVDARFGALGVLDDSMRALARFITVGLTDEEVAAIGPLPEGHGILGLLIVEPKPIRLPDLKQHPDSFGFPPNHPPMTSFLGVPITVRDRVYGNLYLTDKTTAPEFSDADEALAIAIAKAAGIAIDNARLHARVRDVVVGEDRDRIAADLHDMVIQRIFATGLALEGSLRFAPPQLAERIEQCVEDLDETIRQIRTAIFSLRERRSDSPSLRARLLATANEAARTLGFEPRLQLDGPLDTLVPDEVAEHAVAVLTEALSNVARHAHATHVEIVVSAADPTILSMSVVDDGVGIDASAPKGGGTHNVAERAEHLRGNVSFGSGPAGRGTSITWVVPIS